MGLTSEQVHWIVGGVLIAASALLILRAIGKIQWPSLDYLVPSLLALLGLQLALDPLIHGAAAPGGYAQETAQHLFLGLLLIATSLAELIRIRRGAEGLARRLPLAAALLIAAGMFLFHAQHDSDVPMLLLMTQHRMIGATLAVMAAIVLLDRSDPLRAGTRSLGFALLTFLLGAELMIYTEGNSLFGDQPMDHGAMSGDRPRHFGNLPPQDA